MQKVETRGTVNIALIGSGFIGKEHAKAYSLAPVSCPNIAATPVKKILCDTVPDKVAERAKLWGFEEYTTDYREILNRDDIDIVDICTPAFTHADLCIEFIKAGKFVFCEKPLVTTMEDADRLMAAVREYNGRTATGFNKRCCNPDLLIADEPTTALNVTIQAQVLELIAKLQKEFGTSMILITHDLGVVAGSCDTVAVVYAGEIIEYGIKEAIFDHPAHPYTIGLFGALPDLTKNVKRLSPILGLPPDPTVEYTGCCPFAPRCPHAAPECSAAKPPDIEVAKEHWVRCIRAKEA